VFNPLIGNLSKIKDKDLENKITELSKKYFIAASCGQGGVAHQIALTLEMYREEQNARHLESLQKVMSKKDKDIDDLINVD
jgi:hypothetical protein